MSISPPKKPDAPDYEDVASTPDHPHQWGREWQSEVFPYHSGRTCDVCDEMSPCDNCDPHAYEGLNCLRQQAENRNRERKRAYKKALERYEAQMDYYRSVTQ